MTFDPVIVMNNVKQGFPVANRLETMVVFTPLLMTWVADKQFTPLSENMSIKICIWNITLYPDLLWMCNNCMRLEWSSPDTQDEVVGGCTKMQASNPFMLSEKRHSRIVHFMVTWCLTNCCQYWKVVITVYFYFGAEGLYGGIWRV
jgi:hypothetical protein